MAEYMERAFEFTREALFIYSDHHRMAEVTESKRSEDEVNSAIADITYYIKNPFYRGYRSCGKLSDVLEFTSNATQMQHICNKGIDMNRIFFQ